MSVTDHDRENQIDSPTPSPVVYVIDEAANSRDATSALVRDLGYRCRDFSSIQAFLDSGESTHLACLLVDYQSASASGLDVVEKLGHCERVVPLVVTTSPSDLPTAVRLMEYGSVTLLPKPYRSEELSTAIRRAIQLAEVRHGVQQRFEQISRAMEQLTAREKTVLQAMASGQLNKAIARSLDVSVRTIEGDRAKIVDKFQAETTGEVVGKYAQYSLMTELGFKPGVAAAIPPQMSV